MICYVFPQEEFIVTARQMLGILDETKDTQEKL